jgi:ubiquinone/menaquinone biosynthesis C-methylase UbiE
LVVPEYDDLAGLYDETRGGERRGDEYARDIDRQLPPGEGTILEIGVGTGVVALGLRRLGRAVIGLDLSRPMLAKSRRRLGPVVVCADAMEMALAPASVAHAVSVWFVHSVADPTHLFREAARVIRPGGSYVVCTTQEPHAADTVGMIVKEMGERIDLRLRPPRPRIVSAEQVLAWAGDAGFTGHIRHMSRQWHAAPADEIAHIASRSWPAMRALDAATFEEVTRPAIEALRAIPDTDVIRRASAGMTILRCPEA